MYNLLLRLSALDADAASALRVIGFFDALIAQQADVATVLRHTAELAEAPAGIRTADGILSQIAEPGGLLRAGDPPPDAALHRLATGDELWLDRAGAPLPLDELVIERFGLAVTAALGRSREHQIAESDPETLVQQALRPGLPDADRHRLVRRLGLDPARAIRVLAVIGSSDAAADISAQLKPARHGDIGKVTAIVTSAAIDNRTIRVPVGARFGTSTARDADGLPTAWRQAQAALRLSLPSTHPKPPYEMEEAAIVRYGQMGAIAAVIERLPKAALADIPDVDALDRLAAELGGEDMIRTLEAVAATKSFRRAAVMLHLHHNSVGHRVTRAEKVLGFRISDKYGHARLMVAIILQRLRNSIDLF
ncbi:helix-turn-helix domain-containing protein [Microbacterium sp. No. 7]|uniref:helix-turn-helix domain-containing protein n=1 Tax=Microbacterium sp. No. 7 TaxID=1714373 RepID=UPI0006D1DB97|nr:helix-turn-helix domain-containing protein [Microbacterium sp. No. 7]ALJ20460.1 hypothetical protein AOA12_11295 [Microbacterium sp. No. 7]